MLYWLKKSYCYMYIEIRALQHILYIMYPSLLFVRVTQNFRYHYRCFMSRYYQWWRLDNRLNVGSSDSAYYCIFWHIIQTNYIKSETYMSLLRPKNKREGHIMGYFFFWVCIPLQCPVLSVGGAVCQQAELSFPMIFFFFFLEAVHWLGPNDSQIVIICNHRAWITSWGHQWEFTTGQQKHVISKRTHTPIFGRIHSKNQVQCIAIIH